MSGRQTVRCRLITQRRLAEVLAKGFRQREFFSHRLYHLPKAGPDGLLMAQRLCRERNPNRLWELSLYAMSPAVDEFPEALFFDSDLMWHRQQFGKPGL